MYNYSYVTTAGIEKKINQDALLLKIANFKGEQILFAVVCDGIGGLPQGEDASSFVISGVSDWFETEYADMISQNQSILDIRKSLDKCLHELNTKLNNSGIGLGTTYTSMLINPVSNKIIVAHVGDTRLYKILSDNISIVTADHSTVAEEVRRGIISEEEARNDSRQNQITNCIGGGITDKMYDFTIMDAEKNCSYMLCSDGFRKMITENEIQTALNPEINNDNETIKKNLSNLMELDMQRMENDNITAVMVKYV